MTERLATAVPEAAQVLPARLEPDAIGAAQDTIIGMANSAPTVAIGLSLAGLAAASAYGSGPVIILACLDGTPADVTTFTESRNSLSFSHVMGFNRKVWKASQRRVRRGHAKRWLQA